MVTDEEFAQFAKTTYLMLLELQVQVGALSFAIRQKNLWVSSGSGSLPSE